MVTGQKPDEGNPCVTVIDEARDRSPNCLKTRSSRCFAATNLQFRLFRGKFNMGSTGSLVFCSANKNYQLIASRRSGAIPDASNSKWGFTLIRKRPPMKNEKNERLTALHRKGASVS